MSIKTEITEIAKNAQAAAREFVNFTTEQKNQALNLMAQGILDKKESILEANKKDLELAKSKNLAKAFIDRLTLDEKRINEMAKGLTTIAGLKDYVGEIIKEWTVENGLKIQKVRVPIGVIAIIYEARPNVTSDCVGLCIKSSNAVILRGGSDAINSNVAIFKILQEAAEKSGLPKNLISLIQSTDHEAVSELLKLNEYIDLVMPRGGESLIEEVIKKSRIPVIKHYKGVCHIYVDAEADLKMAQEVCLNAKVQRPGVCNAMETMLVHAAVAEKFLPEMVKELMKYLVEVRGCAKTAKIIKGIKRAERNDWHNEYLDLILNIKVVDSLDEAIAHINTYGSHHSDSIITDDQEAGAKFTKLVDSACVYVNASTRFTDGGQFGMGAEIGISTDKLHARGPMALEELTTYKYVVHGSGQIRK
jgi:glutamate-5-semialdehyde dehydrogenase